MDKTNEKNVTQKIQGCWNVCRELADLVALIGAIDSNKVSIPVEFFKKLDLKSKIFMSYVEDFLEYAKDRDNE